MEVDEENGPVDVYMASNAEELEDIMADANEDEVMALLSDPFPIGDKEMEEIDSMAQSYFALDPYSDANLIPWEPTENNEVLPQKWQASKQNARPFVFMTTPNGASIPLASGHNNLARRTSPRRHVHFDLQVDPVPEPSTPILEVRVTSQANH